MGIYSDYAHENALIQIDLLKNEKKKLEEKTEHLSRIIEGLKRGNCWCEMAVGNPMVHDHSEICLKTQQALKEE